MVRNPYLEYPAAVDRANPTVQMARGLISEHPFAAQRLLRTLEQLNPNNASLPELYELVRASRLRRISYMLRLTAVLIALCIFATTVFIGVRLVPGRPGEVPGLPEVPTEAAVFAPAGSPYEGMLAVSQVGTVGLWDGDHLYDSVRLLPTDATVRWLVWAADGMSIWMAPTGELLRWTPQEGLAPFGSLGSYVKAIAPSPDGERVAVIDFLDVFELDIETGEIIASYYLRQRGGIYSVCYISRDHELLMEDGRGGIWLGKDGTMTPLDVTGTVLALSPDSTRLALGGDDVVRIVETATWEVVLEVPVSGEARWCEFSPDDGRLAVSSRGPSYHAEGSMVIFDAASGEVLYEVSDAFDAITSISWSADGDTIAAVRSLGELSLWHRAKKDPWLYLRMR